MTTRRQFIAGLGLFMILPGAGRVWKVQREVFIAQVKRTITSPDGSICYPLVDTPMLYSKADIERYHQYVWKWRNELYDPFYMAHKPEFLEGSGLFKPVHPMDRENPMINPEWLALEHKPHGTLLLNETSFKTITTSAEAHSPPLWSDPPPSWRLLP